MFNFSDFEGIVKVGIIGGVLLRESVSVSKIPKPSEDKSTFSVPLGIPVSMPNEHELDETINKGRNKQRRK